MSVFETINTQEKDFISNYVLLDERYSKMALSKHKVQDVIGENVESIEVYVKKSEEKSAEEFLKGKQEFEFTKKLMDAGYEIRNFCPGFRVKIFVCDDSATGKKVCVLDRSDNSESKNTWFIYKQKDGTGVKNLKGSHTLGFVYFGRQYEEIEKCFETLEVLDADKNEYIRDDWNGFYEKSGCDEKTFWQNLLDKKEPFYWAVKITNGGIERLQIRIFCGDSLEEIEKARSGFLEKLRPVLG